MLNLKVLCHVCHYAVPNAAGPTCPQARALPVATIPLAFQLQYLPVPIRQVTILIRRWCGDVLKAQQLGLLHLPWADGLDLQTGKPGNSCWK
jgi:hypothetical protein